MHLLPVSWIDFSEYRKNGQSRHIGFKMAAILTPKDVGPCVTSKLIEFDANASSSGLQDRFSEFRNNGQSRHNGFNMAATWTRKNVAPCVTSKLIEHDANASTSGLLDLFF